MPVLLPEGLQEEISSLLGWIAAGAATAFIGYGKIKRSLGADSKAAAADFASAEVITLLRKEIVALTEQNQKLAATVSSLQLEIISLRSDHAKLALRLGVSPYGEQAGKATGQLD